MKSSVTNSFRKRLESLPASVLEQADKACALWQEDPYHPSLQFKGVSQKQPIYSARVSINYRVLGLLEAELRRVAVIHNLHVIARMDKVLPIKPSIELNSGTG